MIFPGNKIHLLLIFWNVINVTHGIPETVEIVTPQNTRTVTTDSPSTLPPSPPKPLAKRKPLINWASNDSYIQAYKDLHRRQPSKRNDQSYDNDKPQQDQGYNTLIRSTYLPDNKYPSLTHQSWMSSQPTTPSMTYGPSSPPMSYGPISPPSYGPVYHSPMPFHEDYSSHSWHQMPYSAPSFPFSFLSFLPKKLSFKLILKIILKLVLFKMIVKFIAVLCLLLFIPTLKSKGMSDGNDGEERRKMRQLDFLTNFIFDSLTEQKTLYGEEEMKDIKDIADETDNEDSSFSGPEKAVSFLHFCVSAVDTLVGYITSYLKKQRNEDDNLAGFFLEKFHNFFERF